MRKWMYPAVLALALVSFLSLPAHAAPGWFTCTVDSVGTVNSGRTLIRLTDVSASPEFNRKWFEAGSLVTKEILALGISAITGGVRVSVLVDPDAAGFPEVARMYMLAD